MYNQPIFSRVSVTPGYITVAGFGIATAAIRHECLRETRTNVRACSETMTRIMARVSYVARGYPLCIVLQYCTTAAVNELT